MHLGVLPSDVLVVRLGPSCRVQPGLRDLHPVLLHDPDVLLRVEGLQPEVLVPDEQVLVRRHHARVQEPLGEPPFGLLPGAHVDGTLGPVELVVPLRGAPVVVEQHHVEVAPGDELEEADRLQKLIIWLQFMADIARDRVAGFLKKRLVVTPTF